MSELAGLFPVANSLLLARSVQGRPLVRSGAGVHYGTQFGVGFGGELCTIRCISPGHYGIWAGSSKTRLNRVLLAHCGIWVVLNPVESCIISQLWHSENPSVGLKVLLLTLMLPQHTEKNKKVGQT